MASPLSVVLFVFCYWILLGLAGALVLRKKPRYLPAFFLFGIAGNVLLLIVSITSFNAPAAGVLPLGLPFFPLYFQWDALSAFFVLLLNLAAIGIGLFASRYFRHMPEHSKSLLVSSSNLRVTI